MSSPLRWTDAEILAVCQATLSYLHGPSPKQETRGTTVLKSYKLLLRDQAGKHIERSVGALRHKSDKVLFACRELEQIISAIQLHFPQYSKHDGLLRAATAVYNCRATASTAKKYFQDPQIDTGKPFPFLHCLRGLRKSKLWETHLASCTEIAEVEKKEATISPQCISTHSKKIEKPLRNRRPPASSPPSRNKLKKRTEVNHSTSSTEQIKPESPKSGIDADPYGFLLFSVPGTSDSLRARYVELLQRKAIADLELRYGSSSENTKT